MIILHEHKLIFIKTTKTAGTSIEVFLSQLSKDEDVVTPVYPIEINHVPKNFRGFFNPLNEIIEEQSLKRFLGTTRSFIFRKRFLNHMSASKVKNRVTKDVWDNYQKFAVERNPWDKVVSWYNMVKKRNGLNLSFSDFIRTYPLPVDHLKYMDVNANEIIIDRIVRYECLNDDLAEIFNSKGISFDTLKVKAKSENKCIGKHYSQYYESEEDIKFIANIYKKEIELFDYEFEDKR